MDLLEYQAKELFQHVGIPTLPAQRIDHPSDLRNLQLPYPVVLKSQVRRGGRERAGGIKIVETTIDAFAAAQHIFNLPILGEYPEVLLAEAKYNSDRELYLAVAISNVVRRPVLLGSARGGSSLEASGANVQQVVVDQDFSPFYARRLVIRMGISGTLIQAVSDIVEKMYSLFVDKDLDLVEINPLGIGANGEVMALDGKVAVNDGAMGRHPDLLAMVRRNGTPGIVTVQKGALPACPYPFPPMLMCLEGTIGVLCNGAGLTMATLDRIYQRGGQPANFVNIGGECSYDWQPSVLCDRLCNGLDQILRDSSVRVVLVNLLSAVVPAEQIIAAIMTYLANHTLAATLTHRAIVLRLANHDSVATPLPQEALPFPLRLTSDVEEAVQQAIALAEEY